MFRRRFRVPYDIFSCILVPFCKERNIFKVTIKSQIPIEIRVLAALRVLGRGICCDDIAELGDMRASTANNIFYHFVRGISEHLFADVVKVPEGDYLQQVLAAYANMGLPGCTGG